MRESRGSQLPAVLTLFFNDTATTEIYTLVQQVMLQSLPVARPDQLWRIGDQPHCCDWGGYSQDSDGEAGNWSLFSWEAHKQFRANTPGVHDLAALQAGNMPPGWAGCRPTGTPQNAKRQHIPRDHFSTACVS